MGNQWKPSKLFACTPLTSRMRTVLRSPLMCTHNVTPPTASWSAGPCSSDLRSTGAVIGWSPIATAALGAGSNRTRSALTINRPTIAGAGLGTRISLEAALPMVFAPSFSENSPASVTKSRRKSASCWARNFSVSATPAGSAAAIASVSARTVRTIMVLVSSTSRRSQPEPTAESTPWTQRTFALYQRILCVLRVLCVEPARRSICHG